MTSDQSVLRIGAVTPRTGAEGPGFRFAVWAQGCAIRCSGCFNPHLWRADGGRAVTADDLARQAIRAAEDGAIEGVTLLGGEPFEQAGGFAAVASSVRAAGLSVMVFTGYEREHLEGYDAPSGSAALLAATDLLVDGAYQADKIDLVRPWVGSTNQRFHFLTERYRHLAPKLPAMGDQIEVRVSRTGQVVVNGWATVEQLDALMAGTAPEIGRGRIR